MTKRTVVAVATIVLVILAMTVDALGRRVLKFVIDMAVGACDIGMAPRQRVVVNGLVVEICCLPVFGDVAVRAILAQTAVVVIIFQVAANAG